MRFGYEVFPPQPHAVATFYRTVLGFDGGEGPADADYLVVERDALRVGCSRISHEVPPPRKPPFGSEIVLRVDDVDASRRVFRRPAGRSTTIW